MPRIHEDQAKALIMRHAETVQAPEHRRAEVHMWTAVAVCGAIFIGAFGMVVSKTYAGFGVKESFHSVAQEVQGIGSTVETGIEGSKALWTKFEAAISKEASAQIEANVVEEMKKEISTPKQ